MRFTAILLVAVWVFCLFSASLQAQLTPYDPYAPSEPEVSGVPGVPAKPRWPPFYKPQEMSAKHVLYYAMGWCRPKPGQYQLKPEDFVNINKLPEGVFSGKVVTVGQGALVCVGPSQQVMYLIVHPSKSLSQVSVSGKAKRCALKVGRYVRFIGEVDSRGLGQEKISALELFTPDDDFKFSEIIPDEKQTITARVANQRKEILELTLKGDTLHKLSLRMVEEPDISVNLTDYSVASEGDAVEASGRLYQPADQKNVSVLFAEKVDVKLAQPLRGKKKRAEHVVAKGG